MANIRVDVNYGITDGTAIVFKSPVDCTEITGLIVYYPGESGAETSKVFALSDAHGNNVGDIPNLFAANVVVKVILDVTDGVAYVQNADTNAYIESTFVKTVNGQTPDENGNVVVEGGSGGDGVPCTHSWDGTVLTITSASGTSSADLKGEKGDQGNPGLQGEPGQAGYTPVKGQDYFTDAEIEDIAERAAEDVVDNRIPLYVTAEYTSGDWQVREWSNGECELWATIIASANMTTQWGGVYVANDAIGVQTYPVEFASRPKVECTPAAQSASAFGIVAGTQVGTYAKSPSFSTWRGTSSQSVTVAVDIYVKGYLA